MFYIKILYIFIKPILKILIINLTNACNFVYKL